MNGLLISKRKTFTIEGLEIIERTASFKPICSIVFETAIYNGLYLVPQVGLNVIT